MKRMMLAGAVTAVGLRLLLLRQLCGLPTCPKGSGSCCKKHESWSRAPLPLTSRHNIAPHPEDCKKFDLCRFVLPSCLTSQTACMPCMLCFIRLMWMPAVMDVLGPGLASCNVALTRFFLMKFYFTFFLSHIRLFLFLC